MTAKKWGWWMNDNHTFQKVYFEPGWEATVLDLWKIEPYGYFFVRDQDDRTVFSVNGRGRDRLEEFSKELERWSDFLSEKEE